MNKHLYYEVRKLFESTKLSDRFNLVIEDKVDIFM